MHGETVKFKFSSVMKKVINDISWLPQELVASREGICSVALVTQLFLCTVRPCSLVDVYRLF